MTTYLPDAEQGCLLLADITGYTDYLQGTELEHAQDVLADLLETIIAGVEPPFRVSKLEGDAVLAYLPADDVDMSVLLDTIEATYFSFRRRLRDVVHATTCDCNACILIPNLDLKFFAHFGSYVARRIGRSEELTGSDVVLVHRLLKGSARDIVGDDAYFVMTKSVLDAIEGDAEALDLTSYVERLDVGDTVVFVENLEDRWKAEEERARVVVTPESAVATVEVDFPGSPKELWAWFTEPRLRMEWQGASSIDESGAPRRGVGTVAHCAHGGGMTIQRIVDWQPFTTFTTREEPQGLGAAMFLTTVFAPNAGSTNVMSYLVCDPPEAWEQLEAGVLGGFGQAAERLQRILTEDG